MISRRFLVGTAGWMLLIVTPALHGFVVAPTSIQQKNGLQPLQRQISRTSKSYDKVPGLLSFAPSRHLGACDILMGTSGDVLISEPSTWPTLVVTAMPAPDAPTELPRSPKEDVLYGETNARSVAKALIWRITAAFVTLVSGLVFSGSVKTAMSIVGSDFVSKSGFMFIGERVWNKVKWGQNKQGDSNERSLAKAVLWRVFAAANTLICGTFLAKDFSVASKIAGSDTFFKTGLFFLNERIWNSIKWGRKYEPEYFI
ncbi:unnamed protein product [Choristocarpus tenellus]